MLTRHCVNLETSNQGHEMLTQGGGGRITELVFKFAQGV
jgi:hypothetical protein